MTPILPLLGVAFIGLAVIWPLAFFGHRFFVRVTEAENKKHAARGGH